MSEQDQDRRDDDDEKKEDIEDREEDSESDEDDEEESDKGDDGDDDEGDGGDKDEEDGDDKPITLTKRQLNDLVTEKVDKRMAVNRRHADKARRQNYRPNRDSAQRPTDDSKRIERLEQVERKRSFGHEHGLSPEEVDAVFRVNPNPSKKTLQDPFVKGGIEAIRNRKNVEGNLPRGKGGTSSRFQGKDWKDLKPEERNSNLADRRRDILSNKRGR